MGRKSIFKTLTRPSKSVSQFIIRVAVMVGEAHAPARVFFFGHQAHAVVEVAAAHAPGPIAFEERVMFIVVRQRSS